MPMKRKWSAISAFGWLERFWQDVRYGGRMLVANPGFTLVVVGSLAIGIGANSAAFSWADALLLRPLPVARPGEVVTVGSTASVEGFSRIEASYREYVDIRDRSTSFEGLVAFGGTTSGLAVNRDGVPKLALGLLVSDNFFDESVGADVPRQGPASESGPAVDHHRAAAADAGAADEVELQRRIELLANLLQRDEERHAFRLLELVRLKVRHARRIGRTRSEARSSKAHGSTQSSSRSSACIRSPPGTA